MQYRILVGSIIGAIAIGGCAGMTETQRGTATGAAAPGLVPPPVRQLGHWQAAVRVRRSAPGSAPRLVRVAVIFGLGAWSSRSKPWWRRLKAQGWR